MENNKKEQKNTAPNSFADNVLDAIEEKELSPKPKWHFSLKERLTWTLGGIAVLIGAISIAASLFTVVNTRWSERVLTHNSGMSMLADTLPYFWIFALIIFSLIAYYTFRHTERGYKWPLVAITIWIIIASIVLGFALFALGAGKAADKMAGKLPLHRNTEERIRIHWNSPEEGRIAGTVTKIQSATITIETFEGNTTVDVAIKDVGPIEKNFLATSSQIRIIGFDLYADDFYACHILPWGKMQKSDMQKFRQEIRKNKDVVKNERKSLQERSSRCKDIRPYRALQNIR